MTQTILGAGGAIGTALAQSLTRYTQHIRLVGRDPKRVNGSDELLRADLLNPDDLKKAVQNSDIVYLTVGFPYQYKVWRQAWPSLIERLIGLCQAQGSKLVFFDNVYMYDPNHLDGMTEETPMNPCSRKGRVRRELVERIVEAIDHRGLKALIARSADFYGPDIRGSSVLTETVFNPLSRDKKAMWMGRLDQAHAFTYVPDAAQATALLGNSESAYGQVWHLPTAPEPLNGREWVEAIAREMGINPKVQLISRRLMRLLGLFSPLMRELAEMAYQFDRPYRFDSGKFEQRFQIKPTPYSDGIRQIVAANYRR